MSLFKILQLHSFCFINGLSPQPCLHLPHFTEGGGEKEIKRASFICQVLYDPGRGNGSNSTGYTAQLATGISLEVFHIDVLHKELDEMGLNIYHGTSRPHTKAKTFRNCFTHFLAYLLMRPT